MHSLTSTAECGVMQHLGLVSHHDIIGGFGCSDWSGRQVIVDPLVVVVDRY